MRGIKLKATNQPQMILVNTVFFRYNNSRMCLDYNSLSRTCAPVRISPIIKPQTAPFTRIHCKSFPTPFSIISISVSLSSLSKFSCTRLPISVHDFFNENSNLFLYPLIDVRAIFFYVVQYVINQWSKVSIHEMFIIYEI